MRRFYHAVFVVSTACGLYAGGPKGAREDDGSSSTDDAGIESAPAQCNGTPGVCVSALAPGWSPVLRIDDNNTPCPSNFTAKEIVSAPMAMPDACTCSCNITTQPSCSKGSFDIKYGGSCNSTWSLQANDGQCGLTFFADVDKNNMIAPPKLTGGTCTFGAATGNPGKVTKKTARICNVPMECQEETCAGKIAGVSCIQHVGTVACPPGDFSVPFGVYGDSVSVSCSACTACTAAGQCGAGTIRYYNDSQCTTQTATVPMDGMCNTTNASGQTTYFKYDAPIMNVACTATGTTPTVDLVSKRSICCRG